MPVFCDFVPVEDAWADDCPVLLFIPGPEPARAVPFAELLLVAYKPPDNRIQYFFIRVQYPAVLFRELFSPCTDRVFVARCLRPVQVSAGPAAPAAAPAVFSTGLFSRHRSILLPAFTFPARSDDLLDVVIRIGF